MFSAWAVPSFFCEGIWLSCIALVLSASPPRQSKCWKGGYTASFCCNRHLGPSGNEDCWGDEILYEDCCVVEGSRRKVTSSPKWKRPFLEWCGTMCYDSPMDERPWEMLRNVLIAFLVSKGYPERSLLGHVRDSLVKTFTWKDPASLASECPIGSSLLRLISAASSDAEPKGEVFSEIVNDMLSDPYLLEAAYCTGWPVFRLLALITSNSSSDARTLHELRSAFFDAPSRTDGKGRITLLQRALSDCRAKVSVDECLLASRPWMEDVHQAQNWQIFGRYFCPPRSFATWLDRMEPVEAFPLCVRSEYNLVDDEIRKRGKWRDCQPLIDLILGAGSRGCRVLDIGANIGACSVALAYLGYHVAAFEPLPRNAELMRSSLKLNGIFELPFAADMNGSVTLHEMALSSISGEIYVVEGKRNAGMTITVDHWPITNCNSEQFRCQSPHKTTVMRLDDIWEMSEEICAAKLDVEGHELPVLLGALNLLRDRVIRTLFIEWWPPHMRSFNEEPLSLLWLLHGLNYHIYAPAEWFGAIGGHSKWYMVVPESFPWLLDHWGDIVAKAVEW